VYFRLKMPEDINAKNKLSMSKDEKLMTFLETRPDGRSWEGYCYDDSCGYRQTS
jgi:hypothetical protein